MTRLTPLIALAALAALACAATSASAATCGSFCGSNSDCRSSSECAVCVNNVCAKSASAPLCQSVWNSGYPNALTWIVQPSTWNWGTCVGFARTLRNDGDNTWYVEAGCALSKGLVVSAGAGNVPTPNCGWTESLDIKAGSYANVSMHGMSSKICVGKTYLGNTGVRTYDQVHAGSAWTEETCRHYMQTVHAGSTLEWTRLACLWPQGFTVGPLNGGAPAPDCGWNGPATDAAASMAMPPTVPASRVCIGYNLIGTVNTQSLPVPPSVNWTVANCYGALRKFGTKQFTVGCINATSFSIAPSGGALPTHNDCGWQVA